MPPLVETHLRKLAAQKLPLSVVELWALLESPNAKRANSSTPAHAANVPSTVLRWRRSAARSTHRPAL